ncbi:MAG: glutaredoxin 3 [Gammaproteobacteria bacterium]|nr:glutaredoxin 3 [Gammaproteobacteria bacterium]NNC98535.1 glutaredoxin 3 [Gammaproteobacteria bacterium]NNM13248.1 glutaredoxin 3 [Gammaproteobacteria bacterium]
MNNIDTLTQQADITMYSKDYCPFCVRAKQLFKHLGAEFTEYQVDVERDKLSEMLERSNGARSVPQIFIGEQHIGGYDQLYELHRSKRLDALLFP